MYTKYFATIQMSNKSEYEKSYHEYLKIIYKKYVLFIMKTYKLLKIHMFLLFI